MPDYDDASHDNLSAYEHIVLTRDLLNNSGPHINNIRAARAHLDAAIHNFEHDPDQLWHD